jgi:hypothetical protein
MDFVELIRRRDLIVAATRWVELESSAFPTSIEILDRDLAEGERSRAYYAIVPSANGSWNVITPHDRTDRYVELGGATESDAAKFVWDRTAASYRRLWVLAYPAHDKKVQLDLARITKSVMPTTAPGFVDATGIRALDPQTPPAQLVALASHHSTLVRECVATNEATPGDTLRSMARDAATSVVASVARNHATPTATVDELSAHHDVAVRWTAAGNPALSAQRLAELVRDADFGTRWHLAAWQPVPEERLLEWSADDTWIATRLLLREDATSESIVETFRRFAGQYGTFGPMAVHPATPTAIVEQLLAMNPSMFADIVLRSSGVTAERAEWLVRHRDQWIDAFLESSRPANGLRSIFAPVSAEASAALSAVDDPRAAQILALSAA